jgi:hypothetical protein
MDDMDDSELLTAIAVELPKSPSLESPESDDFDSVLSDDSDSAYDSDADSESDLTESVCSLLSEPAPWDDDVCVDEDMRHLCLYAGNLNILSHTKEAERPPSISPTVLERDEVLLQEDEFDDVSTLLSPSPLLLSSPETDDSDKVAQSRPKLHCRQCGLDPCKETTATMCGHLFCYG